LVLSNSSDKESLLNYFLERNKIQKERLEIEEEEEQEEKRKGFSIVRKQSE
jgi:hypothetical protein